MNHEKNKGAGITRNTGLDYIYTNLPSVEYISLVDADDKIEPETYAKAYSAAKSSNSDIVNFNFLPSTYWSYKTEATSEPIDYEKNCLEAIFEHKEFYTFVVCWSKIYKKELLQDIRFSGQDFFEDGSFAYKVLARSRKMRVIPDTLYYYNIENPDSTCSKITEIDRLKAIFKTMSETIEDWKKLGIYDKYKYDFIDHILLYASLVCPNSFVGDYQKELFDNLKLDTTDKNEISKLKEETKEYIKKMTTKGN